MKIKRTLVLLAGLATSACSQLGVEPNSPHKAVPGSYQFTSAQSPASLHQNPGDEPTWYWTHRQLFSKVAEGSMSSEQLKDRLVTDIYFCQMQSKMNTKLDCKSQPEDNTCTALREFHSKREMQNSVHRDQTESMSRFSSCIEERGWAKNT